MGRRVLTIVGAFSLGLGACGYTTVSAWAEDLSLPPCKTYTTAQLGGESIITAAILDTSITNEENTPTQWLDELKTGTVEICGEVNISDADSVVSAYKSGLDGRSQDTVTSSLPTTNTTLQS